MRRLPFALVALLGVLLVVAACTQSADSDTEPRTIGRMTVQPVKKVPADQATKHVKRQANGLQGLHRSDHCPGGWKDDLGGTHDPCTHGPDPAPAGAGGDPSALRLRGLAAGLAGESAVPCYGDGTDGKRVQAIYAVSSDRPDRYAQLLTSFPTYAARADAVFNNTAARDGGTRHIRWVTDGNCQLKVDHVVLSPAGDDSHGNMRTELKALGYTSVDRKYFVWADASVYCGISNTSGSAIPDATNGANKGPTFSRVDSGCWGLTNSVEAHEIAHAIGAVQLSAPNSNGTWHCLDDYDRECYAESGDTMVYRCPSSQEAVFDCNGDDYFNVDPTPGSWLASHWNLANSQFLEGPGLPSPTATPTTATPTPSPTPTPTPSPTPTPTTTTATPTPTPTATVPLPVVDASKVKQASQRDPGTSSDFYPAGVRTVAEALNAHGLLAPEYVDGHWGAAKTTAWRKWETETGSVNAPGVPGSGELKKLGAAEGFKVVA